MDSIKVIDMRCNKGDSAFLIDDGKTSFLYDTGLADAIELNTSIMIELIRKELM